MSTAFQDLNIYVIALPTYVHTYVQVYKIEVEMVE
jgi:hypothetical protein